MSTTQKVAIGLGIFYLLIGVLGFIPGITVENPNDPDQGLLLGIFAVNTIHNITHLLIGALALWAGMEYDRAKMMMKALAVLFAVLTVGSFIAPVVEGVALNGPDTMLHLVSALLTGYFGFMTSSSSMRTTS